MVRFFWSGGFEMMFMLMFALFFAFIIIQSIRQWHKNNNSPRLTVGVVIVAKRIDVRHHYEDTGHSTSNSYYVTFQVESGDRMEFQVTGRQYGQMAEGDTGYVTFQGTRYLGFERQRG